jgi:diguanylate cyclase (GGDEF)-like protein
MKSSQMPLQSRVAISCLWSVMFLDLNSFKTIDDTQGHAGGDIALRETAHRLMQCCRKEDTICRNGGDEFLYLRINPQSRDNIERIVVKATERIGSPLEVNEQRLTISLSVGIALYPEDGTTGGQLIQNAESRLTCQRRLPVFKSSTFEWPMCLTMH